MRPATDPPAVSVLMSVWRPDPDHLRQALDSVLDQQFQDFELLVVEDPSEVHAAPLLAARADPRVRHVVNAERVPLAASRNQGLGLARGEFVAIADADDVCLPHRLAAQVAFLRAHPEVDLCGGQIEAIDDAGRSLGYRVYPCEPDRVTATLRRYNPIAHPTVMARRTALLAASGYDVGAGSGEDYDLWSRLARAGRVLANLPDVLVRYRLHPGSTKATRLRATLDATLRVKQRYWREDMGLRDRLRMAGERVLQWLPPRLVTWLFVQRHLRDRPPSRLSRA